MHKNMLATSEGALLCARSSLNLPLTLCGGQSFRFVFNNASFDEDFNQTKIRWKPVARSNNKFVGVMNNCLWYLEQHDDCLKYNVFSHTNSFAAESFNNILNEYFRLTVDLDKLYEEWVHSHKLFKQATKTCAGARLLNQDPIENLFSFLCSQNNNMRRISMMVEHLSKAYGTKICEYGGKEYFSFPTLDQLNSPELESELRTAKFGYRAKFIHIAVKTICEKGGRHWFDNLKTLKYEEARRELCTLPGIGPKVADCICLMSLNHLEAVPIDTHMHKIAKMHLPSEFGTAKTLTHRSYEKIGDYFRKVYGERAGWAQLLLFCSEICRKDKCKK